MSGAIIHASTIGDLAVVGMGAMSSLGGKVGKKAVIAEGAGVKMNQKMPAGVVVAGNPAMVIRNVTPEMRSGGKGESNSTSILLRKYL